MCRERIFRPLGMTSTDIRSNEVKKITANFAIGHIWVADKGRYVRADSFPSSDYTIWLGNRKGPGRISSTAADLRKWDLALYSGHLVSDSTLQEAFTPARLTGGEISNYGFGWDIAQHTPLGKLVSHTGDNPGYRTQIRRYTDQKVAIILLNNNESTRMDAILDSVVSRLAK
jgi:CubicO group peptidase (beta-lactamase class C family)